MEDDHQPTTPSFVPSTISAPPPSTTSATFVYQKSADVNQGHNGNGSHQVVTSGNYTPYNHPTIVAQVVRNTGEVQQVIKKQFSTYR